MITHPFSFLKIRRGERLPALVALVVFAALNALTILRYHDGYHLLRNDYHNFFVHTFRVSGFDPLTYSVVSQWEIGYNPYRHPLLAFFMYIPNQINQALMLLTGINFVQWVVALLLVVCALYSFLFLYRILREIVVPLPACGSAAADAPATGCLSALDALLLTALFFSFAYVMLATMVPDHFCPSLCVLLLTLYVAGRHRQEGRPLSIGHTVILFLLTAGISLNNGLKTFVAAWWTDRRRFFSLKFLLLAVVLPCLALWGFARWEYAHFVWPLEHARHTALTQRMEADARLTFTRLATQAKAEGRYDSVAVRAAVDSIMARKRAARQQWVYQHSSERKQGRPWAEGEFMHWTDRTTPRLATLVENVFGEGIQLHQDYLLQDVLATKKPVIVSYRHWWNYAAEGLLLLLVIAGIVCAVRHPFFRLVAAFAALDWLLHVGLGFGINEVYIMSAHWIYLLPIAVAYLLLRLRIRRQRTALTAVRTLLLLLAAYFWIWNGSLLVEYMVG